MSDIAIGERVRLRTQPHIVATVRKIRDDYVVCTRKGKIRFWAHGTYVRTGD